MIETSLIVPFGKIPILDWFLLFMLLLLLGLIIEASEHQRKQRIKLKEENKERKVDTSMSIDEMSVEEIQTLIDGKKLEETKSASEMSISELQGVIKTKEHSKNKPTNALYIIAILLGIIGGIIGYAIAKKDDPKMANNVLIVGLVVTVLGLFFYFLLWLGP